MVSAELLEVAITSVQSAMDEMVAYPYEQSERNKKVLVNLAIGHLLCIPESFNSFDPFVYHYSRLAIHLLYLARDDFMEFEELEKEIQIYLEYILTGLLEIRKSKQDLEDLMNRK